MDDETGRPGDIPPVVLDRTPRINNDYRSGRRSGQGRAGRTRRIDVIARSIPDNVSPAETITRTYDADNELTGAVDANATLTYTYDSGGRQVTAATSSAAGQPLVTLTTGYDAAGSRTGLADGLSVAGLTSYAYDSAYRLTTVTRSLGGVAGPQVVLGYDNADRPTSLARTIGGTGTEIDTATAYDAANRVGTITHQVAGSSPLATYVYGYDNGNRLTSEQNAEGTVTYAYDAGNELTGASGSRAETYTYDSGGNRTMAGYATAAGNQLNSGAGYTYAYDNEGNQTGKTRVSTGNNWTYTWDDRNRLAGFVGRNSVGTLLTQGTYTYDPTDRRIGVDETVSGVRTTTWTVYDGQNTYADFGGTGTLQLRYLDGPAVDQILARSSSGGSTAWYLTDKLGTVRDVASASGTVIDHIAYDSYGNLASETSAASGDRFKFAGREYDAAIGLYYNRARYYDSATGRFIAQDKSGFGAGDTNLFRYVGNAPTNGTDPTGLQDRPSTPRPPTQPDPVVGSSPGPGPTAPPNPPPSNSSGGTSLGPTIGGTDPIMTTPRAPRPPMFPLTYIKPTPDPNKIFGPGSPELQPPRFPLPNGGWVGPLSPSTYEWRAREMQEAEDAIAAAAARGYYNWVMIAYLNRLRTGNWRNYPSPNSPQPSPR